MKIIINALISISIAIFIYSVGCFINLSFDISAFSEEARVVMVTVWIPVTIAVLVFYNTEKEKK